MKLIDKDKIAVEIEKRIKELQDLFKEDEKKLDSFQKTAIHLCIDECKVVLNILDTIETKEVDLEREMDKEWNKCEPIDEGMGLEIASIEHEQFDNIAKHFYELGLNTQKGE